MAWSTCPKCDSHRFELTEVEPANSRYKMFFVQCSSCGAPMGVTEYYDTGSTLKKHEKSMEERLSRIESQIGQLD